MEKKKQERKEKKSYANTTVVEYRNQTSHQMARVASWGLGGVQWKGRQPGQKGLRPVIFIGTIFYGRTYTWYKMAGVVLLCGGIALFSSDSAAVAEELFRL